MTPDEFAQYRADVDRRMGDLDRRHESITALTTAVHEQNAKIGELTGLIKGMKASQDQMHADQREDTAALHEKINGHVITCPMIKRVGRLEVIEAKRVGMLTAISALAGVCAAALSFALKPLVVKLWERWLAS